MIKTPQHYKCPFCGDPKPCMKLRDAREHERQCGLKNSKWTNQPPLSKTLPGFNFRNDVRHTHHADLSMLDNRPDKRWF